MSDQFSLSFHGAAGTVTGSKHLLKFGETQVLMDAGLFQGRKELRLKNWDTPTFNPRDIDHVLLTHTHIDHVGYLPRLVKMGLRAPVHMTYAAHDLAELMLMDSAKIQEEDARYARKKGYSKHRPPLPLYDSKDAKRALKLRRKVRFNHWIQLDREGRLRGRLINSGHILGSAFIELRVKTHVREFRIIYSGDIGRFEIPLHLDPKPMPKCDALIIESTYGNRKHTSTSILKQVKGPINSTVKKGGTVLIPAFAVGRSQQVALILRRLMKAGEIPEVPIHIDSPMAVNATRIYSKYLNKRNVDPDVFEDGRLRILPENVHFHRSVASSKALNEMPGPRIIISASGMLTAGRVLHHLKRLLPDPKNLLMLVGYQAEGTRARALLEGSREVKVHGEKIGAQARVITLKGMSGHGDRDELAEWVASAPKPPQVAFLVHGEPDAAASFGGLLRRRFKLKTFIPSIGDEFDLHEILR